MKEILTNFKPEEISKRMEEVHEIEREADTHRHEITDKLAKAFITPIEREDIIALSHHIDDVTDKIARKSPLYTPACRMQDLVKDSDPIIHHTFDAGEGVLILSLIHI